MSAILPVLMLLLGMAIGAGVIWFLLSRRADDAREQERMRSLADIRVADERASAKDAIVAQLRADLSAKDQLISQRSEENTQLKEQNAVLITNLRNEEQKTKASLELLDDAEEKFVAKLSEPVMDTLGKLNEQITLVKEKTTNVGVAASNLVKALQKPDVRGRWGEMALERVFEICGMTEGRDFQKQLTIGNEDGRQRPDYVVCIPGGMHLVIDAKAPISAYLEATEATDAAAQQEWLKKFVAHVRERVKELNSKSYHQQFDDSPEFVVLYLPTEAIITAALRLDSDLIEFAARQRVLIAGPTVVMSIVLGVAHGWKQEALAANARSIAEHGRELYKRLSDFCGHLTSVGSHLKKSIESYNAAIGSFDSRVMPQARRFEQLKVAPNDKLIGEFPQIDTGPRNLQCSEISLAEQSDVDNDLEYQEAVSMPR